MSMMNFDHPGSAPTDIGCSTALPSMCRDVMVALLDRWPEGPGETELPGLLAHLMTCRRCTARWIALETALELADLSRPAEQ